MSKQTATVESSEAEHKNIVRQESRKRLYFFLKLLFLLGILYINYEFQGWFEAQKAAEEKNTFLERIIRAALFYLTAHLLVSLARIISVYFYIRRKKIKEEQEDNIVLAINRIATLISIAAFIAAVFLLFEITWQTFFTSFSLVAVASVILTKDYISNTVNGMIFMVSDRFVLGDTIKVGNHEGKVVNITLSSVHLRSEEGDLVAIPNTTVYSSDITNLSRRESAMVNVPFELKPELLKDTPALIDSLVGATAEYEKYIKKNSYELLVRNIASDKVQMSFRFKMNRPSLSKEQEIRQYTLRKATQIIAQLS